MDGLSQTRLQKTSRKSIDGNFYNRFKNALISQIYTCGRLKLDLQTKLKPNLNMTDQRRKGSSFKKSSTTTQTKNIHKKDGFAPKQSNRVSKTQRGLEGDDDVWVERHCIGKKSGKRKNYFRSVRTGICYWSEPPTGASHTVLANQVSMYPFLKEFATEPLDIPFKEIRKHNKKKKTVKIKV